METLGAWIDLFPPLALPLGVVFAVYIALILLFADLYYRLYSRDPEAYVFASSLLRTQSTLFRARAERELLEGRRILEVLGDARSQLKELPGYEPKPVPGFSLAGRWEAELKGGLRIGIERRVAASVVAGPVATFHSVKLHLTSGEYYSRTFAEGPLDDAKLSRLIELWFDTLQRELASLEHRLSTLGSPSPEIWGFIDFLYFSVITQTTVGYGDILPNSSRVRLLVSIQVLLGYSLLVVVINLVLSSS